MDKVRAIRKHARAQRYDVRVASLEALRELYAWMVEHHVPYARCGELELRIEPRPVPPVMPVDNDPPVAAPEDPERDALEELLYSSNISVDDLMAMVRPKGDA